MACHHVSWSGNVCSNLSMGEIKWFLKLPLYQNMTEDKVGEDKVQSDFWEGRPRRDSCKTVGISLVKCFPWICTRTAMCPMTSVCLIYFKHCTVSIWNTVFSFKQAPKWKSDLFLCLKILVSFGCRYSISSHIIWQVQFPNSQHY